MYTWDMGTENDTLAAMQCYLRSVHEMNMQLQKYVPSTRNQKIECFGHRLENKQPGGGLIFLMMYTNQI